MLSLIFNYGGFFLIVFHLDSQICLWLLLAYNEPFVLDIDCEIDSLLLIVTWVNRYIDVEIIGCLAFLLQLLEINGIDFELRKRMELIVSPRHVINCQDNPDLLLVNPIHLHSNMIFIDFNRVIYNSRVSYSHILPEDETIVSRGCDIIQVENVSLVDVSIP